jgi:hypothetical protein
MGIARPRGRPARLATGSDSARSDPPSDIAAVGKQPGWLAAAVTEAESGLSRQPAEPPEQDPRASEDGD